VKVFAIGFYASNRSSPAAKNKRRSGCRQHKLKVEPNMRFSSHQSILLCRLGSKVGQFAVCTILLAVETCLVATPAQAQYRASIQGVVTDPSGAVIPKATVTQTDLETNQKQTSTTSDSGTYNFNALPPSRFSMTMRLRASRKRTQQCAFDS
jgi:hypothetical protein